MFNLKSLSARDEKDFNQCHPIIILYPYSLAENESGDLARRPPLVRLLAPPSDNPDQVCIGLMSGLSLMLLLVASYPCSVKITVYAP